MTQLHRSTRLLLFVFSVLLVCAFSWAPEAQAQDEDEPSPVFAQLDYMKVPPDQVGEYLSVEREIWKPMHQARADDGSILGWQLYAVRYPSGTGHDYQYVVVTLYDNLADVEDPEYATYAQQVHSDVDVNVASQRTYDARDLVRSELWMRKKEGRMFGKNVLPL